jgi:two-component system OmpR family sensor kinase
MFRHQLIGFFGFLALTLAFQGAGALWVLQHAEEQVQRGRVASDIHKGFVELSALHQRLRAWVTHYKVGAEGDLNIRNHLLDSQRHIIADLYPLVLEAKQKSPATSVQYELAHRINDLRILDKSIESLTMALQDARPLPEGTQARIAWERLDRLFEQSNGHDLQSLILNRIEQESVNISRERQAADASLALTRVIWVGMSLTLVFASLGATLYFINRLRQPVAELLKTANALSKGHFNHRNSLQSKDEFGIVAQSMNDMAIRLAEYEAVQTQQRLELESLVKARTQALEEANQHLLLTDTKRRQLLADISHELRTPTTAILGEAEVTLRGHERSSNEYQETLGRIAEVARQLGGVIDDLLAMSSTDIQDLRMNHHRVDLHTVMHRTAQQAHALSQARNISFQYSSTTHQQVFIHGDEQRLIQLMMLLLDNAIAYSSAESVVNLSMQILPSLKHSVEITITDQGLGIPANELPHVFERRFRGKAAKATRSFGSGLGLSIARMLVHAHGGTLELMSPIDTQLGKGTQAKIVLPLAINSPLDVDE